MGSKPSEGSLGVEEIAYGRGVSFQRGRLFSVFPVL